MTFPYFLHCTHGLPFPVSLPPSLYRMLSLADCQAKAVSCTSDDDCPAGHYCGDCGELGADYYTTEGSMCRPCSSHPDGTCPICSVSSSNTRYGDDYPACPFCTDIPNCAVDETCSNGSDQQCAQCEQGRYKANDASSCELCGNGGDTYDCGTPSALSGHPFWSLEHSLPALLSSSSCLCPSSARHAVTFVTFASCLAGIGAYKTPGGASCDGSTSEDTQACTACTGGSGWDCGAGSYRSPDGTACGGEGGTDTQACLRCPAGRYGMPSVLLLNETCSGPCEAGYWCGPVGCLLTSFLADLFRFVPVPPE